MLIRRGHRSGLYTFVAVHSTVRGPSLGGCRMWTYDDSRAALRDVLRLSRAMTFKAAVADLALGGGKGVIMLPPGAPLPSRRRRAALLDFGDTVEALGGAYITAEDVGTSSRDMSVIAQRTPHVSGRARRVGGSGDPSPFTALGLEAAIRACCERVFDSPSLEGRTICILGLGNVGSRLARRCARAGAQLMLTDVDHTRRELARALDAGWIDPAAALEAEVDVLAPCALGGTFNDETVPRLRCRIIAGGANNQLAEDRIADLLAEREILWAPDYVVNAGGLINIFEGLDHYDRSRAERRVRGIAATLGQILNVSASTDTTPLVAANQLALRRLKPPA